jgi:hypothetical protein
MPAFLRGITFFGEQQVSPTVALMLKPPNWSPMATAFGMHVCYKYVGKFF